MKKSSLYVFGPLPPSRNGIADYNAKVCSVLSSKYDITCVIADDSPVPVIDFEACLMTVSAYGLLCSEAVCERHLFHLGNNMGHAYMLPWLERISGVVAVHDPSMTHLVNAVAPGGWMSDAFATLVDQAHGQSATAMVASAKDMALWVNALAQEIDFLSLFVKNARSVVVHSQLASRRVRADCPDMDVRMIPHFVEPMAQRAATAGGCGPVTLLCLGFIARAKRIDLVLGALDRLLGDGLPVRLVIAGEVRPEEYDVESDILTRGLVDHVTLAGYVEPTEMDRLIESADIMVNLRDPTSGETSGTLMRSLAAARCTIVTDVGTYAELPDDCVVKLPRNAMTEGGLHAVLRPLVVDAERRDSIGARGQQYAIAYASLDRVGTAYRDAIEQAYARTSAKQTVSREAWDFVPPIETPMIEGLALSLCADVDAAQLWWRDRLLPLGSPGGKLIVLAGGQGSCDLAHDAFGWDVVQHCPDGADIAQFDVDLAGAAADSALLLLHLPGHFDMSTVDRLVDILGKTIAGGGSVTVDLPYASGWRWRLDSGLRGAGFVRLVESTGPSLPIVHRSSQKWCTLSWGATYGRLTP